MKPVPHSKADYSSLEKAGISLPHTYHESPASYRRMAIHTNAGFTAPWRVKIPLSKRLFDITVSGTALLVLSPLLAVTCILIRLDSKGPVLYKSKRVGTGYKFFDLYKFRTMKTGVDSVLENMVEPHLDSQGEESQALVNQCKECRQFGKSRVATLNIKHEVVGEKRYLQSKKEKVSFIKFGNDPCVTPLGKFLRNTRIEELPQLLNILKGDMSLVGNQPLFTHEAEKLHQYGSLIRFAAPAGLTGLWQVTKRSKKNISERERAQLDIKYAENYSFWLDMKIILKTFPALLQKENV